MLEENRRKPQRTNSLPSPRLCVSELAGLGRGPGTTGTCVSSRKLGARGTRVTQPRLSNLQGWFRASTGQGCGSPRGPSKPRVCGQRPITGTVSPTPSQGSSGLGTTRHPSALEWTQPPPRPPWGKCPNPRGERTGYGEALETKQ